MVIDPWVNLAAAILHQAKIDKDYGFFKTKLGINCKDIISAWHELHDKPEWQSLQNKLYHQGDRYDKRD